MKKTLVVAALITSSPLLAQKNAADSSRSLEEVVVSATKSPLKTSATGKVVIVIDRSAIERAGSRDLTQLLSEQGGLFINGAWSNPGKDKNLYVRGARVEHTLVTIDGVPVYDASGIGSNFDLRLIPIERVERIEILKGSQGTLYGSDAIAGVINIITRKAGADKVQGSALLSYGSFNTVRSAANINGRSGRFDYTLGANHFTTKGISEAATPPGEKAFAANGFRQTGADASVGYQFTPKVHVQTYLRYTEVSGNLDAGDYSDALDYTYANRNLQGGLRGDLKIGSGRLRLLYNYNSTRRRFTDDSTLTPNLWDKYNHTRYTAGEHFGEAFYAVDLKPVKLTVGADYRQSSMSQTYGSISSWGNDTTEFSADSVRHRQFGAYANAQWSHQSGFNIEAGGRFNNHSDYGSHFAWNINPSYLLNRQVKLFANLSSGFRTPSLYQLFSEFGNRELKPEQSINYEAGLQLLSADGTASLRATWFNRDVKNLMVFFTDPTTFQSRYINRDRQKDHGLEIDGKVQFSEHVYAKLFYSYADGEIFTKVGAKDTAYYNLFRRPKETVALTLGFSKGRFQGNIQTLAAGRVQDQYFDRTTFRTQTVTLNSYVLLNVYAEYALPWKKLRFFADLRNVTSAKYQEIYGYNTPGFNAYGGVRIGF